LQIVLVANTGGFFRKQLELNPVKETEMVKKYFLDFLKLPGILGVRETQFSRSMDGRRIAEPAPDARRWPGPDVLLVAKDGTFKGIFFRDGLAQREAYFKAEIEAALR
jgi:hypothetical protein